MNSTSLPASHAAIPSEVAARVSDKLHSIERGNRVRILFAVESGSRAWGFPSPDSDYDVRFVYAHEPDWYLSVFEGRDVIETPLEGDLDISGWDLRKAMRLLLKPNPVLLEWLRSPIVYRRDATSMRLLSHFGGNVAHVRPSTYHYLHLAESQYRRFIEGRDEVGLKKYFYVIRPILALMWLRSRPNQPVPMSLAELTEGIDLPRHVERFLAGLLTAKAVTKELGKAPRNAELDAFVLTELATAKVALRDLPVERTADLEAEANALFRRLLAVNGSNGEPARPG